MTGVAGGEDGLARDGNAGALDVAGFDRSAALPLLGSECRRGFRSFPVEWQHSAAENLGDGQIETHKVDRAGGLAPEPPGRNGFRRL
jgi:hypothetical protein